MHVSGPPHLIEASHQKATEPWPREKWKSFQLVYLLSKSSFNSTTKKSELCLPTCWSVQKSLENYVLLASVFLRGCWDYHSAYCMAGVRSVAQGGNRMSSMAGGSESKFIHTRQKSGLSKNLGGSQYPLLLGNVFSRYKLREFLNYSFKQKLVHWHVPGLATSYSQVKTAYLSPDTQRKDSRKTSCSWMRVFFWY